MELDDEDDESIDRSYDPDLEDVVRDEIAQMEAQYAALYATAPDELLEAEPPSENGERPRPRIRSGRPSRASGRSREFIPFKRPHWRKREKARILGTRDAREELAVGRHPGAPHLVENWIKPHEDLWRFDKLTIATGRTLVVAIRKTGKSTLLLSMPKAYVTGEPFLGEFEVKTPLDSGERVLLMNLEMADGQFYRWCEDAGLLGPAFKGRLAVWNLRGRRNPLGSETLKAEFIESLERLNVRAVIADPWSRIARNVDQDNNSAVTSLLGELDDVVGPDRDLIISAHAGWVAEGDIEVSQVRARGASALEDWPDTIIRLGKVDGERFMSTESGGRDVEVVDAGLVMDPTTRELRVNRARSATEARKAARDNAKRTKEWGRHAAVESAKRRVLDVLHSSPGLGVRELYKRCEGKKATHDDAVADVIAHGWVDVEIGSTHRHSLTEAGLAELARLKESDHERT